MENLKFIAYNGYEKSDDTIPDYLQEKYTRESGLKTAYETWCSDNTDPSIPCWSFNSFLTWYCNKHIHSFSDFSNYFGGDIMCSYDEENKTKYVTFAPGYGTEDWPCECYNNKLSMICKYTGSTTSLFNSANMEKYIEFIDRISLSHESIIMNVDYDNNQASLNEIVYNRVGFFGNDYTAEISFHYNCSAQSDVIRFGNEDKYVGYITKPVITGICDQMFAIKTELKEISIPRSVTNIGESAFTNCTNLEYFGSKRNISGYGDYCFANCTSLRNLDFREYDYVNQGNCLIGEKAFSGCTGLTSIEFTGNNSNKVFNVSDSAFTNCISLSGVNLSYVNLDTTLSSGDSMFAGCTSLTTITSSVQECIPNNCFKNCESLKVNNIDLVFRKIGDNAFDNAFDSNDNVLSLTCTNNTSPIFLGSNFISNNSLTSVTINTVANNYHGTELSNNCFDGAIDLKIITISQTNTGDLKIGDYAFKGLTNLQNIYFTLNANPNYSEKVILSGDSIFSGCGSFNIYVSGGTGQTDFISLSGVNSNTFSNLNNNAKITINFNNLASYNSSKNAISAVTSPDGWSVTDYGTTTNMKIIISKST